MTSELYLGIDVGIKNLALCVVDSNEWLRYKKEESKDPGIKLWKILDVIKDGFEPCCAVLKNGAKKGQTCGKRSGRINNGVFYCGSHAPDGAVAYKPPRFPKKKMLKTIFTELDRIELLNHVNYVVIETQPRINQKMKMLSSCIEAYFTIRQQIDRGGDVHLKRVSFSSAKNKLKVAAMPFVDVSHIKDPYRQRKFIAQKHTEHALRRAPQVLDEHYTRCKKKDDLADSFLHCLFAMEKKSR